MSNSLCTVYTHVAPHVKYIHIPVASLYVYVCSVIDRSWSEDVSLSDSDGNPHWCRMAVSQNAPGGVLTNGNESGSSMPSEATVKSLIKSFDTAVPSEDTTFLAAFLFPLILTLV